MKAGHREDFAGFILEKSACGWWVIDPDDDDRGRGEWLFASRCAARRFVLDVLGGF